MKKRSPQSVYRRIFWLGMMFTIAIFMAFSASAFEFDNVLNVGELKNGYPELTVVNAFGLGGDVAKLSILENTEYCIHNCYAVINVTLYDASTLPFTFDFIETKENKYKNINFNIYTRSEDRKDVIVPDYEKQCVDVPQVNGTIARSCTLVQTGSHEEQQVTYDWKKYKNTILPAGEYIIKIESKMDEPFKQIDWAFSFQGISVDAIREYWATWTQGLNAGIVMYHKFDNATTSGTTSVDSLNRNNGSITNAVTGQSPVACKINECYYFDGSGDYVNFGQSANIKLGQNFSVAFWAKTEYPYNGMEYISRWDNGASRDWVVWHGRASSPGSPGNETEIGFNVVGSPTFSTYANSGHIDRDKWSFIVYVQNGTGGTIFVNGTYTKSAAQTTPLVTSATDMVMGLHKRGDGLDFKGYMDEFGFWNRTLTVSEISDLYNGGAGISFTSDFTSAPVVTLEAPIDNYATASAYVNFTCSAAFSPPDTSPNISIIVDDVDIYSPQITCAGTCSGTNKTVQYGPLSEGAHTWTCIARSGDSGLNGTATANNFAIDTTNPKVDILVPLSGTESQFVTNVGVTSINYSLVEPNPNACFYYNGTGNTTITCNTNITTTLDIGTHTIIIYANDTAGNLGTNSTTFLVNVIRNVTEYHPATVVEQTKNAHFLNITASNISTVAANLSYNGTIIEMSLFSYNGTNAYFTANATAPNVATDTQLNISYIYTVNGVTRQTAGTAQTVYHVGAIFFNCSTPSLNFTLYNEEDFTGLTGTFDYLITYGVVDPTEVSNYGTFAGNSLALCVNNTVASSYTVSYGEIGYTSTGYSPRRYYLFSGTTLTNLTQNISLYSILTTAQTSFQLTVRDTSQNPYTNIYTQVLRWYPELNEYRVVDMGKTDENGQTIIHVVEEDVDYKLAAYQTEGTNIKTSNPIRMFCATEPCNYEFIIGDSVGVPWQTVLNVSNFLFDVTYNRTTKIVSYVYNDSGTTFNSSRLNVVFENTTVIKSTVCNTSSSSSYATITCNLSAYSEGNFIARAYLVRDAEEKLVYTLPFTVDNPADIFGLEGLLIGWFIIMSASLMFLANKIAGILIVNAAFIFVRLIGFISFSPLFLFSLIGVSVILVVLMRGEVNY